MTTKEIKDISKEKEVVDGITAMMGCLKYVVEELMDIMSNGNSLRLPYFILAAHDLRSFNAQLQNRGGLDFEQATAESKEGALEQSKWVFQRYGEIPFSTLCNAIYDDEDFSQTLERMGLGLDPSNDLCTLRPSCIQYKSSRRRQGR